jgi:predicted Zn-dependent protease
VETPEQPQVRILRAGLIEKRTARRDRVLARVGSMRLFCFVASFLLLPGFFLAAGLAVVEANSAQEKHASESNLGGERRQRDFQAAVSAYTAQRYADAQRMLQPLIAASPNNFEINELAGLVYVAQGQDEKANVYLARAVRLKPRAAAAVTNLAANLVRLHRNSEAEVQLRKAVELEPGSDEANHNLGEFYIQVAELAQAIPYLQRSQELNSGNYNNCYDLALAY